ncbi:MAG: LysR family transcriptional regulator, partial [Gammaproteobacteria bacterium]|nr:LysR family transcriptional regulator [Gammaproteobacteria bacterium]
MELRQLHHFLAVVQAGSISGAAAALGLTQQAVSKSVRALEASVGVELFARSGGRLAPNPRGRALATK